GDVGQLLAGLLQLAGQVLVDDVLALGHDLGGDVVVGDVAPGDQLGTVTLRGHAVAMPHGLSVVPQEGVAHVGTVGVPPKVGQDPRAQHQPDDGGTPRRGLAVGDVAAGLLPAA